MLSILYTGGPQVLHWGWVKTFCITTVFSNKYSSRRPFFFPLSRAAHMKTVVIFLYCTSLLKQKVRGYLNTSTVYTKKGKGKYSHKKFNEIGLFIFAFPMINDAPVHTRKLMAKQGSISNSSLKHTNTNPPCCSNLCSRILKCDNSKSIVRSC